MTERIAGRFELQRMVGAGGMGEVWLARDASTGEPVALKLTHATADLARFAREASVLASLDHPAMVRHVAHGEVDGRGYLAMAWLDGEDLSVRLKRGRLDVAASLDLVRRAAEALAVAHRRGVVHRDVKPANLFLAGGELTAVTVLDFGIARVEDAVRTGTGTVIGTPGYMSPEQARGQSSVDARTDVFALGCVLFECIAGRAPFVGPHPMAVLVKLLIDAPPRLSDLAPGTPAAVESLVAAMLAKEPTARPADGAALAELITQVLSGGPLEAVEGGTFGAGERRVTTVMLWRTTDLLDLPTARLDPLADTVGHGATASDGMSGLRVERLADGTRFALFSHLGTPRDHCVAACRYALDFVRADPGARVSVATDHAEDGVASATGPAVDRASAMLMEVPPGQVVLDPLSAALSAERYAVERHPWGGRLVGPRAAPAHAPSAATDAPLLGRDRELRVLESALDDAASGRAGTVLVLGDAGLGKSALARALRGLVAARGDRAVCLDATAEALDVDVPYALLGTLLARRVDGAVQVGPALAAIQRRAAPAHEDVAAELAAWLQALAERRLVVLVLDDAHWADEPSVRALVRALDGCDDAALLVVVQGRPSTAERFGAALQRLGPVELRLRPLSAAAAGELVARLGGDATGTIVARAQGNPYVVEELVRASQGATPSALPASVLGVAQANVDRLAPSARRVLRAASVLGQRFTRAALLAVLGGDPRTVADALDDAVRADAVREDGAEGFSFRHALTRDAVYAMIPERDRVSAHGRAARWIEAEGSAAPAVLAHHLARAGEVERAIACFRDAAQEAVLASDRGAIERIDAEVAALSPTHPARVDLLSMLTDRLLGGDGPAREAAARRALSMLGPGSPRRPLLLARLVGARPDDDTVGEAVAELRLLAAPDPRLLMPLDGIFNVTNAAAALRHQGEILALIDRHQTGTWPTSALVQRRQLERALDEARAPAGASDTEFFRYHEWRFYLLRHLGRVEEFGVEVAACAALVPSPRSYMAAQLAHCHAEVAVTTGDLPRALALLGGATATFRALGGPYEREVTRLAIRSAEVLSALGRHREAVEAVEAAEAGLSAMRGMRPLADAVLASAWVVLGRRDEAEAAARRGLQLLHPRWHFDGGAFRPRAALAGVLLACGADGEARAQAREALADVALHLAEVSTPERRRMYLSRAPGVGPALGLARELGIA
jgi:tetratricopeptide (TPR) repeat protein